MEFTVIGGVAARLHDTGHATVDIDICPSSVEENLECLAEALRSIDARLRVEGVPEGSRSILIRNGSGSCRRSRW